MSSSEIGDLRVDGARLWDTLMQLAEIGATPRGGSNRQALTDDDKRGRDLFVRWCEEAGCSVEVDQIGNIFARRSGEAQADPVLLGSHLDTQPTGGRFDGVYGVLAGLEVVRTLNERDVHTRAPLEIAVWTNEEGSRFTPAMLGSGVWSGVFDLSETRAIEDKQGLCLGDELARIGYAGEAPARARPLRAAFEVHIEQGPILEREDLQIGVVTGIQGLRWYDVSLVGEPCHAGPTPMEGRRDPFRALPPILDGCYALAEQYAPWGRATFGDIRAEPGSRNTVPERVILNADLRHPDAEVLDEMDTALRALVRKEAEAHAVEGRVDEHWHMPVTTFAPECVDAVRGATERLGYSHMEMVSGAGHDSLYVAGVAPTSMIFVPCEGGVSHNEGEQASPDDLEAGCNVLLHAALDMASRE